MSCHRISIFHFPPRTDNVASISGGLGERGGLATRRGVGQLFHTTPQDHSYLCIRCSSRYSPLCPLRDGNISMSLAATAPTSRSKVIGFWFFKIVFGLAFIAAGCAKIYGPPAMVAEFDAVGLGQWFRYFTGALEIIGAIMLLTPSTTGAHCFLQESAAAPFSPNSSLFTAISSIRSQWASSLSPLLGTSAIRCWARSVDSRPRAFFIGARSIAHSLAHRSPPVSNCL